MNNSSTCFARAELLGLGMSARDITTAVATGSLIRARRDRYFFSDAPGEVVRAARIGGRLTCVSLLSLWGVFVYSHAVLHVMMPRGASRMREPDDGRRRLASREWREGVTLHWAKPLVRNEHLAMANIHDALAHAIQCQSPRHAVATLDSALHLRLITMHELRDLFASLPTRIVVLLSLVDAQAESGPETLMRLMLRGLGCTVELQVRIDGVGRVDLLVDGWLIIECDSEAYHGGWAQAKKDRARDLAAAARGYTTIRPTAELILYHPSDVLSAVQGLLAARAAQSK